MSKAFTLVELLVVITIIVLLLALLTPAMDKAIYRAELLRCQTNQRGIASGVLLYAVDFKRSYPYCPYARNGVAGSPKRISSNGVVNDTRAPRFAVWDAYVSRAFGRTLTAFAAVNNRSNSKDPNTGATLPNGNAAAIYRPEVGRTLRVGLRLNWTRK